MIEDRADDRLPIESLDPVAGILEPEQHGAGDLPRQRLAVLDREHRIGGSVDDQGWLGDRGKRRTLAFVLGDEVVVVSGGDVAGAADFATGEVPYPRLVERAQAAGKDPRVDAVRHGSRPLS